MKYFSEETVKGLLEKIDSHYISELQALPHIEIPDKGNLGKLGEDFPNWHTGTPTEDGQYFVAYRWGLDNKIMHDMAKQICYGATVFSHGTWKVEFPFVVLAWQKIEPFEEATE